MGSHSFRAPLPPWVGLGPEQCPLPVGTYRPRPHCVGLCVSCYLPLPSPLVAWGAALTCSSVPVIIDPCGHLFLWLSVPVVIDPCSHWALELGQWGWGGCTGPQEGCSPAGPLRDMRGNSLAPGPGLGCPKEGLQRPGHRPGQEQVPVAGGAQAQEAAHQGLMEGGTPTEPDRRTGRLLWGRPWPGRPRSRRSVCREPRAQGLLWERGSTAGSDFTPRAGGAAVSLAPHPTHTQCPEPRTLGWHRTPGGCVPHPATAARLPDPRQAWGQEQPHREAFCQEGPGPVKEPRQLEHSSPPPSSSWAEEGRWGSGREGGAGPACPGPCTHADPLLPRSSLGGGPSRKGPGPEPVQGSSHAGEARAGLRGVWNFSNRSWSGQPSGLKGTSCWTSAHIGRVPGLRGRPCSEWSPGGLLCQY